MRNPSPGTTTFGKEGTPVTLADQFGQDEVEDQAPPPVPRHRHTLDGPPVQLLLDFGDPPPLFASLFESASTA